MSLVCSDCVKENNNKTEKIYTFISEKLRLLAHLRANVRFKTNFGKAGYRLDIRRQGEY